MRGQSRFAAAAAAVSIALVAAGCGTDEDKSAQQMPTTVVSTPDTTPDTTQLDEVQELTVTDAWCRQSPAMATVGGCFMVINGGAEDDALVGISVDASIAATPELHETTTDDSTTDDSMADDSMADGHETTTTMASGSGGGHGHGGGQGAGRGAGRGGGQGAGGSGGMMHMRKVDQIPVSAGGTTELAPGGYHVMLMDLVNPLEPGQSVALTLTFEKAGELTVNAEVRAL